MAPGAALVPDNAPEVQLVHRWLDTWSGVGLIIAGMTNQSWDVQLTAYAARDWRANFYPVGMAHSIRRRFGVGADTVTGGAAGGVGGAHADSQVNVGINLVISTVIGLAGGYYADRWLGIAPWLTMIGLGVGTAAGFVNLFRSTR